MDSPFPFHVWIDRFLGFEIHATPWTDMGSGAWVYVGFNLIEAAAWTAIAARVVWRAWRRPHGRAPWAYAAAFLAFAVTDLIEMDRLTVGLLATKGVALIAILACRRLVIARLPGARW